LIVGEDVLGKVVFSGKNSENMMLAALVRARCGGRSLKCVLAGVTQPVHKGLYGDLYLCLIVGEGVLGKVVLSGQYSENMMLAAVVRAL
jgi:hypothetical protein